jgi:hypothetical protein
MLRIREEERIAMLNGQVLERRYLNKYGDKLEFVDLALTKIHNENIER